MAIRKIVTQKDEILRKNCKPVEKFDKRLWIVLDDMAETLSKANGVGLAAPQIGILRRYAIVNLGDSILEMINPTIVKSSGKQRDVEGCLSCPGQFGYVTRPLKCVIRAQDRNGKFYEKDLTEMYCRCALHEIDHLDGKLFLDIVEEMVDVDEDEEY